MAPSSEPSFYVMSALGGTFSDWCADALPDDEWPEGWAEPFTCPACNRPLSSYRWPPPHYLHLIDFRRFGDYLATPSWVDGFFSERLLRLIEEEGIRGVETVYPAAEVVRITGRGKSATPPPSYHLVELARDGADFDDAASGHIAERIDCPVCGAGKYARQGAYERIIFRPNTWKGHDLFHARGIGDIIATQRFVDLCFRHKVTNVQFMPCEHACMFFDGRDNRRGDPRHLLIPVDPRKKRRGESP